MIERERELVATNERLTVIASIDMLSGLANRRGFQSRLDFEWMKAQQHGGELSLLMIDVDHFKLFNDSYGHPEGDVCLTRLGEAAGRHCRRAPWALPAAMAARNLSAGAQHQHSTRALEIGEMVRAAVQELGDASLHLSAIKPSPSASAWPAPGRMTSSSPGDLIEAADAALYAAKHRGRNAVVEHGIVRADG